METLPNKPDGTTQALAHQTKNWPPSTSNRLLTASQRSLLKADHGTTIRNATMGQLSAMWNKITFYLNIKITDQEAHQHQLLMVEMTRFVIENYKNTTIEAILSAYNLLVTKKLGIEAYASISPKNFGEVMAAYQAYRQKELSPQLRCQAITTEEETQEPTQEDIRAIMIRRYQTAYQAYQNHQPFDDLGNALYDFLDQNGILQFSVAKKNKMMALAAKKIRIELQTKTPNSSSDIYRIRNIFAQIQKANFGDQKGYVIAVAKKIALHKAMCYFVRKKKTADLMFFQQPEKKI